MNHFFAETNTHYSVLIFALVPVVILALLAFEIWMIVDAVLNPKLDTTAKALWIIGMILLHPIVGIVYFFVARRRIAR